MFILIDTGYAQQSTSGEAGLTSKLQKLSLTKELDSHSRSSDVNIEEWIRQTSAVAVAPDTLVPNETRDTNSPTLTDSSLANSIKVRFGPQTYAIIIQLFMYIIVLMIFLLLQQLL